MLSLKDLTELLDKWPLWKKMKESPERIDALEKRIKSLEKRLSGTGDICPKCKQPTFELFDSKMLEDISVQTVASRILSINIEGFL